MKDMTKGNPTRLILQFAIPLLIGQLFQQVYSLTDTRIVGSFLGENALAAVGATNSLNSLVIGFLMGMTNGFAIVTARFLCGDDCCAHAAVCGLFETAAARLKHTGKSSAAGMLVFSCHFAGYDRHCVL